MSRAPDLAAQARDLRAAAAALAASLHAVARTQTTPACDRAVLRLFGVAGLDRAGRPLAAEVVDRFGAGGPAGPWGDIGLPFAVAAAEYGLTPAELAQDVAAGNIDLRLEAELLADRGRRAQAEALIGAWVAGAWERFDAQRTARQELLGLLGETPLPRFGLELAGLRAGEVAAAVRGVVAGGADLLQVPVPVDRELRRGLGEDVDRQGADEDPAVAPAGSQRGLALVRAATDEAAAEAGRYVQLATRSVGLSEPEQAIVAGFERIDAVFTDPLEAVVDYGVDPARALADHAFAVGLLERTGATLVLGPGPLAVAPEMTRGEPPDQATRLGRSLALQALAVELTRCASLPDERIAIAGLSREPFQGPTGLLQGFVELALRMLAFPAHALVLEEPPAADGDPAWSIALTAWLGAGTAPAILLGRRNTLAAAQAVGAMRGAAAAAAALVSVRGAGAPEGEAATLAGQALAAGLATIRGLASDGWEGLLVSPPVVGRQAASAADEHAAGARQAAMVIVPRAYLGLPAAPGPATLRR
ncbi:MAG: lysine 5,6-aminomutase subunit alpha TIM-barrel domain-containing protein [Candidatus Limnocylindrales bacterium]